MVRLWNTLMSRSFFALSVALCAVPVSSFAFTSPVNMAHVEPAPIGTLFCLGIALLTAGLILKAVARLILYLVIGSLAFTWLVWLMLHQLST